MLFSRPNEIQVLDLSNNITINDPHYIYCGGFADIYHGERIQEVLGPDQQVEEKITQVCVFCHHMKLFCLILIFCRLQ